MNNSVNANKVAFLRKFQLNKLAKLVEDGIVSPNDTITTFPICYAAEKHLGLKDSVISNEKDSQTSYERACAEQTINIIELFEAFYPNVEITDLVMRQKSAKSILGKEKNLEIERIAKLMVMEVETPEEVKELKEEREAKILNNKKLTATEKRFELDKIRTEDENKSKILYRLIRERVGECIESDEEDKLDFEKYDKYITELLDENIPIDYNKTEQLLLTESRFSASTKKALARVIYYRIKKDKQRVVTDLDGYSQIREITIDDRQSEINNLKDKYEKQLAFESIEKIERPSPEWKDTIYDGRYNSRLSRLVDTDEFLRCKDLYGMHIVISKIPENFVSGNDALMTYLTKRNRYKNKDEEKYKKYNQKAIEILTDDFIARLKGEGITKEYLQRHPDIAEKWYKYQQNTKILPDSEKYKRKENKYSADHIKFEIGGDSDYTIETQLTSKEVSLMSKGNGPAAHSGRFGKTRIAPSVIENESKNVENLSEDEIKKLKKELEFLLPNYYIIKKDNLLNKYKYYKCSTLENCKIFYEDLNIQDDENEHKKSVYNRLIYAVDKYCKTNKDEPEI